MGVERNGASDIWDAMLYKLLDGEAIGRWIWDRYITSAKGKGYVPLYTRDSNIAINMISDKNIVFAAKMEKCSKKDICGKTWKLR